MKFLDLILLAIQNLYRRKVRSVFNLSGIILGCTILLLVLAAISGLRDTVYQLFDASEVAKKIIVFNNTSEQLTPPEGAIRVEGNMSAERKKRIYDKLKDKWIVDTLYSIDNVLLEEHLRDIESIPGVKSVQPKVFLSCGISLNGKTVEGESVGGVLEVNPSSQESITNGRWVDAGNADNQILVSEFIAYQLGCRTTKDFEQLIGKEVTLNFYSQSNSMRSQIQSMLESSFGLGKKTFQNAIEAIDELKEKIDEADLTPKTKKSLKTMIALLPESDAEKPVTVLQKKFQVVGIRKPETIAFAEKLFSNFSRREQGSLRIHYKNFNDLYLELNKNPSYYFLSVTVDSTKNLSEVSRVLEKEKKMEIISAVEVLKRLQKQIDSGSRAMYVLVGLVLLVSAIGISNTLFSSTFERTPEFGIMKAVGSTDRTILWLMLSEGVLLGLAGATIAIFLSVSLSSIAQRYLETYLYQRYGYTSSGLSLFHFSVTSMAIVFGVSVLVCVVASAIPGWRAARLDPIRAMQRR